MVTKEMKEASLEKWQDGLKACSSIEYFECWWDKVGSMKCSFCDRFWTEIGVCRKHGAVCPLFVGGESKICAPEWEKIDKANDEWLDMAEIKQLVEDMLQRIEMVEVTEGDGDNGKADAVTFMEDTQ